MRRAQGSTLGLVGLFFDRRSSDRGYAYVGASRAKLLRDVYLVGRVRRSDWRPVGGDPLGGEQAAPGSMSGDSNKCSSDTSPSDNERMAMDAPEEDSFEAQPGEDELSLWESGWNCMPVRDWAEPQSEDEPHFDWGMARGGEGLATNAVDDAAGVFE